MQTDYRILVVDDDPTNTRLLARILKREYVVDTAASGEEALKVLPGFRPDLILLDISMKGIDGYEVCRRIRADGDFSLTKILLVSGKGLVAERLEGYQAGADDFICKPYVNDELKAKIQVYLRLKRSEEVDRIKDDLLTLFSHETKTPLAGIIGLSELLSEDEALAAESRQAAMLINANSHRLLEFVRKTTLLCDLKKGRALELAPGSLSDCVRRALTKVETQAAHKGIEFAAELEAKTETEADWGLIREAIGFVLENAIKFSPRGGTVAVRMEPDGETHYRLVVSDHGEGIPAEWINSVFDAFAIRDVAHHHQGQGLSLAIAKQVAEHHGGTISASSPSGEGATFTFTLPISS